MSMVFKAILFEALNHTFVFKFMSFRIKEIRENLL